MGILTMMRQRLLPNCKIKSDKRGMILSKESTEKNIRSVFFLSFFRSFVPVFFVLLWFWFSNDSDGSRFLFILFPSSSSWTCNTYEFIHYDYVAIRNTNPFWLLSFSFSLIRHSRIMIFTDTKKIFLHTIYWVTYLKYILHDDGTPVPDVYVQRQARQRGTTTVRRYSYTNAPWLPNPRNYSRKRESNLRLNPCMYVACIPCILLSPLCSPTPTKKKKPTTTTLVQRENRKTKKKSTKRERDNTEKISYVWISYEFGNIFFSWQNKRL